MLKPVLSIVAATALLAACGSDTPAPVAQPSSSVAPGAMVAKAEGLVLASLPSVPYWKGVKAKGVYVSDSQVCVDRTLGNGDNAGYVVVSFPAGSLGEPQDGLCASAPTEAAQPSQPIDVPADLKGVKGLVTRNDLGDDWPLTVPFGVLSCERKQAGVESVGLVYDDPG